MRAKAQVRHSWSNVCMMVRHVTVCALPPLPTLENAKSGTQGRMVVYMYVRAFCLG